MPHNNFRLGLQLPRNTEVLYQPEYWRDRAADLRRLAEEMRDQPEFYSTLRAQAQEFERLAEEAERLRLKRAHHFRPRNVKYFWRADDEDSEAAA